MNENVVDFDNLSQCSDSASSKDEACDGFILGQSIEYSDSSPNLQSHLMNIRQPTSKSQLDNKICKMNHQRRRTEEPKQNKKVLCHPLFVPIMSKKHWQLGLYGQIGSLKSEI